MFSGARNASVPTTTTSATVPTFSEARYTNVLNNWPAVNKTAISIGDFSVLRIGSFATGTPTQPGYVPPFSEPFSFIGYHSLINTTRVANSTIRDFAAVSSVGELQRIINSPLDIPVTLMNHGLLESRLPSLPNVPNEASMRGIPSLPSVPSNLAPQYEPCTNNYNTGFNSSRLPSSTFHVGEIV